MLQKSCFALVALLGLASAGCQTPYGGGGCAGGCCGGSCGVSQSAGAPVGSAYALSPTYAPAPQRAMPSAFGGGGSGSR